MPFLCSTSDQIFTTWTNAQAAQTQTATTNLIWSQWITTNTTSTASNCYISLGQQQAQQAVQMSAEEQMRRAQQMRDFEERVARQKAENDQAEKKANELLLECLNEQQRAEVKERQCFHVRGGRSGHLYRINTRCFTGNIDVLRHGVVQHRLCGHDRSHGTPWSDQLLAQKFYLEHHEDEFLRIANRH